MNSLINLLIKRNVLALIGATFLIFSVLPNTSFAAQCASGECDGPGEYVCQNGTMCCTGGGCPTYVCLSQGFTRDLQNGVWMCCASGPWYACVQAERTIYKPGECDPTRPEARSCTACWAVPANTVGCSPATLRDGTCAWCDGEDPPPSCNTTSIGSAGTSSPIDATVGQGTGIDISWTAPSRWGNCCSSCGTGYRLYIDGSSVSTYGSGTTSTTIDTSSISVGDHTWRIRAYNGDAGYVDYTTNNFTVTAPTLDVKGLIWDATDRACTIDVSEKASYELLDNGNTGDPDGTIGISIDGVVGTWDPPNVDRGSYIVNGVPEGTNLPLNLTLPTPVDMPGFKFNLLCVDDGTAGRTSSTSALVDISDSNKVVHLGLELTSSGWFTAIDTDIFGGCSSCSDSVLMGVPDIIAPDYTGYLIQGDGTVFGNRDINVKDANGLDVISDGGLYVQGMEVNDTDSFWPVSIDFEPPVDAEEMTNCSSMFAGGLDTDKSYYTTTACVQGAIDNQSSGYYTNGDGVATVYITDTNTLTITNNLTRGSDIRSILLISRGPIEFSEELGSNFPADLTPHIRMGFISEQSISFPAYDDDPRTPDKTVIIDGLLVAKNGNISIDRDKELNNSYPAVVVKYDPVYHVELTEDVREHTSPNYNGLSVVDITWEIKD